ncbi:DUF2284 domain-containing protein [Candidatus Magnetomoraceae bacterium gMMP-15]
MIYNKLIEKSLSLGVSNAKIVPTDIISIEDDLAEMCKTCESYGKSANCPPNAMSVNVFRTLIKNYKKALFFKIDVPPHALLSEERFELYELLHYISSQIESFAIQKGFTSAKAFAGGSCKLIFCKEKPCQVLDGNQCCHPEIAHPSMSGVGINVFKLVQDIGWKIHKIKKDSNPDDISSAMLAGLVLLD